MSTIPTEQSPQPAPQETVEERFRRLEAIWHADTRYSSSSREIREHPAFQEIIRLGDEVVPLMLRDLERAPHFWVWALATITGANPVPASDRGNIARMSEAWVRWGKENGYRW
jgi:hypothetical protein